MRLLRVYFPSIVLTAVVLCVCAYFISRAIYSVPVLRWAHVYEVSSPYHQQALWAAAEFERRTEGRYAIKIYPASSLGKEVSINEAVNLGAIDLIYTGSSLAAQRYGPLAISDYPYVIDDFAHWQAYRDSDFFKELAAGYESATGDEIMSLVYYGFRHTTSNKPISKPEDMLNLKIRVPNAAPFLMMPDSVGANPAPIPFSEAYLALQQGVVEAAENPLTTIKYKRFYEVQTHINLTGHIANSLVVIGAGKTLAGLPQEDAQLLRDVIQETASRVTNEIRKQERQLLAWYPKNGITIIDSDRAAFKQRVLPALLQSSVPFSAAQLARLQALAQAKSNK